MNNLKILKKHQKENPFTWKDIIDKGKADRFTCERLSIEIIEKVEEKIIRDMNRRITKIEKIPFESYQGKDYVLSELKDVKKKWGESE